MLSRSVLNSMALLLSGIILSVSTRMIIAHGQNVVNGDLFAQSVPKARKRDKSARFY